jgi:signal transduction histidine kinase/ligand-binding sensor domain-containing protein
MLVSFMGNPHGRQLTRHSSLTTRHFFFVLTCTALLCTPSAFALDPALDISQYAHTAWKVRDGFTKGVITSLAQTPDGYVWLGTELGLLRFDGVRAVQWQPPAGQQLPGSLITSLLTAHDGTLWIGTFTGLASWKDGKFRTFPELAGQSVTSILEAADGTVWIGIFAESGGGVCDIRSGIVHCERDSHMFGTGVMALYEDSKGTLWLGLHNGVCRWKPGSPQFFSIPEDPFGVTSFNEDEQGQLLFSSYAGIRRLVDGRVESYPSGASAYHWHIVRMFRDHHGGLWVGTSDHGLVHIHGQGRPDEFSHLDGLSGDYVTRFLEDREGNIWVATYDGIDRFREYAISTISTKQGLSSTLALSVLGSKDGSVWIGTEGGVNHWKNGQISLFGSTRGSQNSGGKLNREVTDSLFEDSSGRIWVSTAEGKVGYLQDDRFTQVRGVPRGSLYSITEVPSGHLWLSHDKAGLIHVYEERVLQEIPWAALERKDWAKVLVADPFQNGLWLGFQKGGVAYFADGTIRALFSAENGLGEGRVSDLRFGIRGALWAATGTGLSRIKDGHVTTLTSTNGLPCDQVVATIEDNDHSMWLYLACGLVRISQAELDAWVDNPSKVVKFEFFDTSDGVRSHAAAGGYQPLMTKSADGKIWFLPWDGVSVIDPRHLAFNKLPPPVHIGQVIADRKTYWQNSYGDASSSPPKLPPLVRDLTIDYTALSLVVPEKVHFRVKLEGWDRDWKDAGNERRAFYSNLPPRKYRFRVMACNNSGVWNEAGTFLDFSVAPAYYQTMWFRLSCMAAFLALLGALYQLRLRQVAQQFNMRLEERVNERTRIARELHDSLLQGFQGLMFRLQAVRNMLPGRPTEASEALDMALERGDKAIAEGRDTVADLRQPVMDDGDIAQALTALGEELAAQSGNGAAPCVRVLVEGKQRELNPMLRDEIYRIAREALRNAFRHAQAQKIEAEITYSDSQFLLHVRDDGRGIDPKVTNQGARAGHWGLPGMRERAKRFGGRLEVWSEQGVGTEIQLIIPAPIAYGKSSARPRFWFLRTKNQAIDGQKS